MAREAKPFELTLTEKEAEEITGAAGDGGHQTLHRKLTDQLQGGNLTVSLTDADLGQVVRYMTQYGSGGFQGRLRRAFQRPLAEQLGI